jgi:hypothetical protein
VLKTTALLCAISMSSSCATSPPEVRTTEAACTVLKPIEYHLCSADEMDGPSNSCDTQETALRIYLHNRDLAALCAPK